MSMGEQQVKFNEPEAMWSHLGASVEAHVYITR